MFVAFPFGKPGSTFRGNALPYEIDASSDVCHHERFLAQLEVFSVSGSLLQLLLISSPKATACPPHDSRWHIRLVPRRVVASFAFYTALDLGGRIRVSKGWPRRAWLATAALAMGGGIWSMHFIAMLASLMPMPVGYDLGLTVVSLLV